MLIPEQLLQFIAGCRFTAAVACGGRVFAPYELKILAEVPRMLVQLGISPPVATLVRGVAVVAHAVDATTQIGSALGACLAAAGIH